MEAILRGVKPTATLAAHLGKHTSAAVPGRLVDRVIATLIHAGVPDHGLSVGEADGSTESEAGGDLSESQHDVPPMVDPTPLTMDMTTVDKALAAAVRATGVLAEVGRPARREPVAECVRAPPLPGIRLNGSQSGTPKQTPSRSDLEAADRKRRREKLAAELLAAEEEEAAIQAEETRLRLATSERAQRDQNTADKNTVEGARGGSMPRAMRQQTLTPDVTFKAPTAEEAKSIEVAEALARKELEKTRKEAGITGSKKKSKQGRRKQ
jgi:hypothetical protein